MLRRGFFAALCVLLGTVALVGCGSKEKTFSGPTAGAGVNGYLWRAALETLSFMPMADVDAQAGAIITDWYVNPDVPDERMKVSAFILDASLRADALRINVVRQSRTESGVWVNQPVRAGTELRIEDAILTRARELRIATARG